MVSQQRVVVVLPAYNAAATLERTFREKHSSLPVLSNARNRGYGGNQKTGYAGALQRDADVIIMLHPDYQYTPKLIGTMASLVTLG